jgi:hypothetical protein
MKTFKEILSEVFNYVTISMIFALFVGSFLLFLLIDSNILEALKDSLIVTFTMIFFVIFGRYIKSFEKEE